ncbi:uncharacterized protein LOC118279864 [Spodoptera frugiperda]|uniref:Uncharacterized protein LOC118279864 n=1 Tax=Spodoptera frugiperda TaxID=7108 RepID=A0A9R0DIT2_SPOFR|nr:uncharacterized protein LOC118279864 [Spodoptera frugiperda]
MALIRPRYLLILLLITFVQSERVNVQMREIVPINNLREAMNGTKADTLNLPANASSIRENITDTFSCENRTYGYYADVDNDCQVFHVCLPSQTPSGRNVTYRWSFICPNQTVFNQEVLTCTLTADSIDCKDSPDFYHLNMEIGKEQEKTDESKKENNKKIQKRKPEKRRENIIMHNSIMEEEMRDIEENLKEHLSPILSKNPNEAPVLLEAVIENIDSEIEDAELEQRNEEELDRIVMEKNMRNMKDMYEQRGIDNDRRDNDNDRVDNDNDGIDSYNERDIDDGRELQNKREVMRNERVLRRQTFRFRSDV